MPYDARQVRQAHANREAAEAGGLFAAPLPSHAKDPWTSRAAAVAGQHAAATHRAMILTYLDRVGAAGATADEVDAHFGWPHLRAARRLSDLAKAGLVSCAGDTRTSAQGCAARVYRMSPASGDGAPA